jgi:hypothetical protein
VFLGPPHVLATYQPCTGLMKNLLSQCMAGTWRVHDLCVGKACPRAAARGLLEVPAVERFTYLRAITLLTLLPLAPYTLTVTAFMERSTQLDLSGLLSNRVKLT